MFGTLNLNILGLVSNVVAAVAPPVVKHKLLIDDSLHNLLIDDSGHVLLID